MSLEKVFKSLTKKQHAIMDVLCAIQHPVIAAANINPTTLGSLCAKGLVNVKYREVSSTCVMEWNMVFHKEFFDMITQECVDKVLDEVIVGRRISAIRVLWEYTGWGIHEAKRWLDFNLPK
jgi:hypothetical protein